MPNLPLLAVPNVSEGRAPDTIAAIGKAFDTQDGARLLDVHCDADHHRSVFTLAGHPGRLSAALLAGAAVAVQLIDVGTGRDPADVGQHPHVGAIDVMPVVYLELPGRGAACAEALVTAAMLGEDLGIPVLLYGELARGRTRAELRRGGVDGLAKRLKEGDLRPDFGPSRPHPTAGATLLAAREPLVAFNAQLGAGFGVADARRIAGLIREGGEEGLPGLRAIAIELTGAVAQVSMNVERPLEVPLARVLEAVARHAEIAGCELVGLAPRAALEGFPTELLQPGFDPDRHVIENAIGL
jgi:glutamate formiminotransferase/glutamate formiminotransferase/formiminotetrahydrofolate cyclodeaminase